MRTRRVPRSLMSDMRCSQLDVARIAMHHIFQEATIDLVNDLHMPRQQLSDQIHLPGFQRFGHEGMIGVGEHRTVMSQALSQSR